MQFNPGRTLNHLVYLTSFLSTVSLMYAYNQYLIHSTQVLLISLNLVLLTFRFKLLHIKNSAHVKKYFFALKLDFILSHILCKFKSLTKSLFVAYSICILLLSTDVVTY